ncbi:MAG: metal-dependent hydrolase [Acidobacteria bacterium]|nr:metal-dependent hydrolase [Acidobacteriota bacterium]MCL5289392.1 metal-dependent hydrolase [Acidobacteriota bacterium]
MEPVTHGLTSIALGRAGLNKFTRMATPMLLVAGYAPDVDWITYFISPSAMFHYRRAITHSLAGAMALAVLVAAVFWWFGRKHPTAPLRFWRALLVCGIGACSHLLLDLPNRYGLRLFWPFSDTWVAWNIIDTVDIWALSALLLGLLMPGLFRMVSEEIGARPERRGPQRGAIVALALLAAYATGKFVLHERAVQVLSARLYHGEVPVAVGAFPSYVSPLAWRGIVETENTIEEVEVRLGPGSFFDPERGVTNYKPDPSPMLEAARQTRTFAQFISFAKFPIAHVVRMRDGYRVELRDLRFSSDTSRWAGFMAVVEMDEEMRVQKEFISSAEQKKLAAR